MEVQAHDDPVRFAATVGKLYSADPVRHTVALTVLAEYLPAAVTTPVMLTVHRDGELYGAAVRIPPWPLIASALPVDAAAAAADVLAAADPRLSGVNGPRDAAEGFARAWTARTGVGVREVMANRLYALGDLREPVVPGHGRVATEDDVPLLVRWWRAFQIEAMDHDRDFDRVEEIIRRSLAHGDRHHLWVHDEVAVSWARVGAPADGMSRVGPVYTLPERRGHGYGSAVTAAASRWARHAGAAQVLLFTDLANPTSNSIYQKLGYRPVFDACELEFTLAQ